MKHIYWHPKDIKQTNFHRFCKIINKKHQMDLSSYDDVYKWSIENYKQFWSDTLDYVNIIHSEKHTVVSLGDAMSTSVRWFKGMKLNFAENLIPFKDNKPAIIATGENMENQIITYSELYQKVKILASSLKNLGVCRGDRVAGYLPNISDSVIAMLATSSIGAVWSSSSTDFGVKSVTERFSQIEPKVIFSTTAYQYNGKVFDNIPKLIEILEDLPTLEHTIIIDYLNTNSDISSIPNALEYESLLNGKPKPLIFEQVPFNHPLYIMYTSGTTGLPKSIVHGVGGTLIQHKKELMLHCDAIRQDVVFYYTTCGWMMWNWLISFLSTGSTIVLYDGSPFYPDSNAMWNMIDEHKITIFGTSAKFIDGCKNISLIPKNNLSLESLRMILSTGSPLVDESFDYVYENVKSDVLLGSISGGTDIISCFALSSPVLPVYRGELQCRGLGMDVDAFDPDGNSVRNRKGELVCKTPFPSMPIHFWNDANNKKYHNAYFNKYPNVWSHGDFIEINDHGGLKIFGRSDATLNPGGVRIGTAEIYRVVENFTQINDSLVIGQEWNNDERIILFIKLGNSSRLSDQLITELKQKIRTNCSPRHVPEIILPIDDIPYTISGKKVELAVKKIINGDNPGNKDALANPESLDLYVSIPELE